MKENSLCRSYGVACLLFLLLASCATYKSTVVPFKMPAAYPNATEVAGATVAARSYDDKKEAQQAFGFDIRGTGILPVQVIFDNKGSHPLRVVAHQTLLVDEENSLWPILDSNMAYERIQKSTELGKVLPEGGKGALLAGAAGAVIGAAVGIVTGENVGEAIGKGAAVGAAGGLVGGGLHSLSDTEVSRQIGEDLGRRSLQEKPVPPHEIAYGFIFFPGEAKKASELRLTLQEMDTGKIHKLTLPLRAPKPS